MLHFFNRTCRRIPNWRPNFIMNKEIRTILELQGFGLVEEGLALPTTKRCALSAQMTDAERELVCHSLQKAWDA
jgi:hypothetical protein